MVCLLTSHVATLDPGSGNPDSVSVYLDMEPVLDAASVRATRRASACFPGNNVLFRPLHSRSGDDRSWCDHLHVADGRALSPAPTALYRGDHRRGIEIVTEMRPEGRREATLKDVAKLA